MLTLVLPADPREFPGWLSDLENEHGTTLFVPHVESWVPSPPTEDLADRIGAGRVLVLPASAQNDTDVSAVLPLKPAQDTPPGYVGRLRRRAAEFLRSNDEGQPTTSGDEADE